MSWLFNPPEPTAQPVASGLLSGGEGDLAPAVAPYYTLTVPHALNPSYLFEFFPHAKGTWELLHEQFPPQPTEPGNDLGPWLNPLAIQRWTSRLADDAGNCWNLAFGETHPPANPINGPIPIVLPHSWTVWFGPSRPLAQSDYVVWMDVRFETLSNRFLPLHPNTFRSRRVRAGALGTADFGEFPASLTVRPWWP